MPPAAGCFSTFLEELSMSLCVTLCLEVSMVFWCIVWSVRYFSAVSGVFIPCMLGGGSIPHVAPAGLDHTITLPNSFDSDLREVPDLGTLCSC